MYTLLRSSKTMMILLFILALGAACATFIENDYGTQTARIFVYDALWYEVLLGLSVLNMALILYENRAYKVLPRFLFHIAFIIILFGALLTRYFGFEGIMSIREGESANTLLSSQQYIHVIINEKEQKSIPFNFSAYSQDFEQHIDFNNKNIQVNLLKSEFSKEGRSISGSLHVAVSTQGEKKIYRLKSVKNALGKLQTKDFGGIKIALAYGAKEVQLPFSMKLQNFTLERYAGSSSPSAYSSDITVIDKNKKLDTTVFMNNTLSYGGYKFFQSSYDLDEKGTILSVNKDPGKVPTYIGYGLLFLGLILNFFDKRSRFMLLIGRLKNVQVLSFSLLFLALFHSPSFAASDYVNTYVKEHAKNSAQLAKEFGGLVTQSRMGRMKPLDTLNREILYKLSGKSSLFEMDANQIVLGMFSRPGIWQKLDIIKIKSPKLKELIGVPNSQNLISFSDLFYGRGEYKIERYVNQANRVMPAFRDTFEKDLIRVDERINIAFMVFRGSLLKIFPLEESKNNKWVDFKSFWAEAKSDEAQKVRIAAERFLNAAFNRTYDEGLKYISRLKNYQQTYGKSVIPPADKIENEILFNEAKIFPRLTLVYTLLGLSLFIYAFSTLFSPSLTTKKIRLFISAVVITLFFVHTFGMGLRWYISGHAPMSDTYESIVYIAWSAMFAGVLFFRKSIFALSASTIMAGIFMFAAHLSHIDPEITNLVPVLKSFWLTLHVSIITGSYGFLGIAAILAFMNLLLFLLRNSKRVHFDNHIKNITDINEVALIIGLALLVIGNFLGGIWANESWGRYWGWDPKETWSYISIIIYTMVIHLRMLKKVYSPYLFNALTLVSFASILMTYFGVNFYLAGMHSYATGDPLPVPTWVYVLASSVLLLIAFSYPKRKIVENYN